MGKSTKRKGTVARGPGEKKKKIETKSSRAFSDTRNKGGMNNVEVLYERNPRRKTVEMTGVTAGQGQGSRNQATTETGTNNVLEGVNVGYCLDDCRDTLIETEVSPSLNISMFDEIGGHVPEKLKEKIWDGKFIDLSLLLKSARDLDDSFQNGGELKMKDGKLVIERQIRNKPIFNIDSWTSAFLVFISVMLEKHPQKAQELLKYMRDIRLAAGSANNATAWVRYDEQFRLKNSKFPDSSWGNIDNELWLLSMSCTRLPGKPISQWSGKPDFVRGQQNYNPVAQNSNRNSTMSSQSATRPLFRPILCCWGYNKGKCTYYDRCKFSHTCSVCGGRHPAFSCRQ